MSEYFILPGTTIGKSGLPGGKLEAKTKPVQISDEHAAIIGPSLNYLVSQGKVSKGLPPEYAEPVAADDDGKSVKRLELEAQATELEIEFTDATKQKDLVKLIDETRKELEKQATELEIEFTAETKSADLIKLVREALA